MLQIWPWCVLIPFISTFVFIAIQDLGAYNFAIFSTCPRILLLHSNILHTIFSYIILSNNHVVFLQLLQIKPKFIRK